MININKLKGRFLEMGYTQTDIAKALNIAPSSLSRRLRTGVFGSDEMAILVDLLKIDNPWEYFFLKNVTR